MTITTSTKVSLRKLSVERRHYALVIILLIVLSIALITWRRVVRPRPEKVNPFTNATVGVVDFPLYYPTRLPIGFKIDPSSVSTPQTGVVIFDAIGPKNAKLYFSEEARSSTFNLGGFYKQLHNLEEISVSDGAIATGQLGNNTIASRATNKTWILSNSTADIPESQLVEMMQSIIKN